jgi:hypothetical protein
VDGNDLLPGVQRAEVKRGDRLVAYPDAPLRQRLFIEVTRVARDGSWADISVQTWAVMWKKRQPLDERGMPPTTEFYDWTDRDLFDQMTAWDEHYAGAQA